MTEFYALLDALNIEYLLKGELLILEKTKFDDLIVREIRNLKNEHSEEMPDRFDMTYNKENIQALKEGIQGINRQGQ